MDPSAGVDAHLIGVGKYHAGGAQRDKGAPRPHHAGAHRGRGVVSRAARHRCAGRQAGSSRGSRRHRAGQINRFIQLTQQGRVDLQLVQHLPAPAAVCHVQQVHAGGVGYLGSKLSRQLIAQVVLGQQDVTALGVQLRLMAAHPQDLTGGKAGEGRVGGELDEPLLPYQFRDLLALPPGAPVAPQDGGAEHPSLPIQHHQTVHLAGQAHALYFTG